MKKKSYLWNVVNKVLGRDKLTRGNDAYLIYQVWTDIMAENNLHLPEDLHYIIKKYFPDTITRIRRKFNQEGLYLPDKDIQLKRKRSEIDYRNEYKNQPDPSFPVWTTREGEKINVKDMAYEHIENTIGYLETKLEDIYSEFSYSAEANQIEEWIKIFNKELENRKKTQTMF